MQVHPDVFRWLGALGMMEGGKLTPPASKRTGKVAIPDDLSDQFENGQVRPSSLSARWLRDPGRGEILNAPLSRVPRPHRRFARPRERGCA